jgi:hypothetical protein
VSLTTIRHSGVPENTHSATTAAWRIGEKPHDPLDPGPFGTPGWQPDPRRGRRRRGELPDPLPTERRRPSQVRPEPLEPQDLSPMREAAYRAFLRDSEELHMAHLEPSEPNRVLVYLRWYLQIVLAVLYWRVLPFPDPPSRCRRSRAACEARHADRHIGRAPVAPRITSTPSPAGTDRPESAETTDAAEPPPADPRALTQPPALPIEWRTAARPFARPAPVRQSAASPQVRPAPVRRPGPSQPGRPHRPHPVMAPRNGARSRRRADTRRIFLHTYGVTRDQNHRNLNWPRGSWAGFDIADTHPANPRRGAIKRRRNHRPRNLALARSFPTTTPVVPVGATSRPAPVASTARLLPLPAPQLPSEALIRRPRSAAAPRRSGGGAARTTASGVLR